MTQIFDFGVGQVTIHEKNMGRYTPDPKTEFNPEDILIVGTNELGDHWGGAARYAHETLGLQWGIGEGISGQAYAFPTLNYASTTANDKRFEGVPHKVTIERIHEAMANLEKVILDNPDKIFWMTKIGLGIAGWELSDIHRAFWGSAIPFLKNVRYPMEFEITDDSAD